MLLSWGYWNVCTSVWALEDGSWAHEQIIQSGCGSDVLVGSSPVDMYAKCGGHGGGLENINKIFSQDVLLRTAMLLGNVTCGEGRLY
jgi:hypothetical protein